MPDPKPIRSTKLTALLRKLSPDELRAFSQLCPAGIARTSDSPTGFDHFYRLIFDRPLPPHAPHDDTLDAVYWMLYTARAHLLGSSEKPKDSRSNPFGSLARG